MKEILIKTKVFSLETWRSRIYQAFCLFLCILSCAPMIKAQQTDAKKILFPIIPIIAEYEYAPHHFMQWITGSADYSMIEAAVGNEQSTADVRITMTEKATGKRIFYCQSEVRAKSLRATGKEAYVAKIDFKQVPGATDQPPSYGFGFRDKENHPILWRVTLASLPSERGAGLNGQPTNVSSLRLQYRDLGTAVGEGTAVQIGDKIYEAAPWTEISAPPYFVAFRGSVTEGYHIGNFLIKSEKWSVTASPTELRAGAQWILKDDSGNLRTFIITAQNKDELTIDETNQIRTAPIRLVVRSTPLGYALRSLEWQNSGQKMRIAFAPELPPLDASLSGKTEVAFTIGEGKNARVSSGTISIERQADRLLLSWMPKSPDWAKSKAINTLITLETDGYSIETTAGKK